MATEKDFRDTVWYRISKGKPQPEIGLYRVAVESVLSSALQRLGNRVAADPKLCVTFQSEYPLVLASGEISLIGLSPTLLLSKEARKQWRVTMTDIRFPLQFLPNRRDVDNPPRTDDYYFYTVHLKKLIVRNSIGEIPAETSVQLFGNYVPLINDAALAVGGELFDDLCDCGTAIMLETGSLEEVVRQAEHPTTVPMQPAQ